MSSVWLPRQLTSTLTTDVVLKHILRLTRFLECIVRRHELFKKHLKTQMFLKNIIYGAMSNDCLNGALYILRFNFIYHYGIDSDHIRCSTRYFYRTCFTDSATWWQHCLIVTRTLMVCVFHVQFRRLRCDLARRRLYRCPARPRGQLLRRLPYVRQQPGVVYETRGGILHIHGPSVLLQHRRLEKVNTHLFSHDWLKTLAICAAIRRSTRCRM